MNQYLQAEIDYYVKSLKEAHEWRGKGNKPYLVSLWNASRESIYREIVRRRL